MNAELTAGGVLDSQPGRFASKGRLVHNSGFKLLFESCFYLPMNQSSRLRLLFAFCLIVALAVAFCFWGQTGLQHSAVSAGFLAADKEYGVTVNLTRYDDSGLVDTLTQLREAGLLWLRQPVLWSKVEPQPGQFQWEALDRVFEAVAKQNESDKADPFKLIAVLNTSPAWARPPGSGPTTPPTHISNFGNFASVFAGRYGHLIDHYQIWHEPNLSAGWGEAFVNPPAYATLLREAALNIREADPEALILTAGLAPTRENGPLNLNELEFLTQLYQAGAGDWFDIVAAQPYGFDFDPADPPDTDVLNFRRAELLRQVMLDYGDAGTPIWATAFGWNALPPDWAGRPSPWRADQARVDPPPVQAQRTAAGLDFARQTWPWLGPMLAIRWDSGDLATDDPARGFALSDTPLILAALQQFSTAAPVAFPGRYPATHPSGQSGPGWRFAGPYADIPRDAPQTLTIPFKGTRLNLSIDRGPYRGYLWVTIDGEAANALPKNNQGQSYVVLYNPQRGSDTITLAQNLTPGLHQAVIEADGGWGQWAITGWEVSNSASTRSVRGGPALVALLAIIGGGGLLWQFSGPLLNGARRVGAWFKRINAFDRLNEWQQITLVFGLALGFYFAPGGPAWILFALLALSILYRPDLGLALIAFSLSFFQAPKQLSGVVFSMTEMMLVLAVLGVGWHWGRGAEAQGSRGAGEQRGGGDLPPSIPPARGEERRPWNFNRKSKIVNPKSLDWAALALLALSLVSTFFAPNFGVSMFEWRVLVFGSVVYYFLVRLGLDFGPPESAPSLRWVRRLVDALVAGAVLHAVIALYGYFLDAQFVNVEGVRRAVSPVYASPNNLSLFLERVWPILLVGAVFRMGGTQRVIRRALYGTGLTLVTLTLVLTFSRGGLLGLPVSVTTMAVFYGIHHRKQLSRRLAAIVAGILAGVSLVLLPLSQVGRFAVGPGSSEFFRVKAWQSALNMMRDHWLLGVGLNNFLYQYRTRYILPEAWQEPNLSHPHNIFLDFGTRLGVGGIAALLWLQGAFWITAWRVYSALSEPLVLALMGSMAVFLSHGQIDNAYFLVDLAFIFFLTAGIVQGLWKP